MNGMAIWMNQRLQFSIVQKIAQVDAIVIHHVAFDTNVLIVLE